MFSLKHRTYIEVTRLFIRTLRVHAYRIIVVFVANANILAFQFLLNVHCACTL